MTRNWLAPGLLPPDAPIVIKIRREFADGRDEPWRGGAVATWWREYVMDMLAENQPSYRAKTVAVHLRLENTQLVTIRPRARA